MSTEANRLLVLLSLLTSLISPDVLALPLQQCVTSEMLMTYLPRGQTILNDEIGHGGYFVRKATRSMLDTARPSEHGFKHCSAHTEAEAKAKSYQAAQYLPTVDHIALERQALHTGDGEWLAHNATTLFKFVRFNGPIGYDQGQPTRWIRVELTSGVFHGHPMSLDRVRKYLPTAQP